MKRRPVAPAIPAPRNNTDDEHPATLGNTPWDKSANEYTRRRRRQSRNGRAIHLRKWEST